MTDEQDKQLKGVITVIEQDCEEFNSMSQGTRRDTGVARRETEVTRHDLEVAHRDFEKRLVDVEVGNSANKVKSEKFDGSTFWTVLHCQFNAVAYDVWTSCDKSTHLLGHAADILQCPNRMDTGHDMPCDDRHHLWPSPGLTLSQDSPRGSRVSSTFCRWRPGKPS
jgi:hypothetical protein